MLFVLVMVGVVRWQFVLQYCVYRLGNGLLSYVGVQQMTKVS